VAYIVIGQQMATLPHATHITGDNVESALAVIKSMIEEPEAPWVTTVEPDGSESGFRQTKNMGYQAWFLLDEETSELRRIYYDKDSNIKVSDPQSAFETLGSMTDYKYFDKSETTEMSS